MAMQHKTRILVMRAAGLVLLGSSTLAGGIGPVSCSQSLPQQLSGPVGMVGHHAVK